MKPHERRASGYPCYKLARWDERLQTFVDGRSVYATEAKARAGRRGSGRYRVSLVTADGRRVDYEPFEVRKPPAA
jgi:hypothetical protein